MTNSEAPIWLRMLKAFAGRVIWSFLVLLLFPFPLSLVPGLGEQFTEKWNALFTQMARGLGTGVLGMKDIPDPGVTGSGDTTESYLFYLLALLIAVGVAAGWTAWRRAEPISPRVDAWLRAWLRVNLATTMISYGVSKILPQLMQMPAPTAIRLTEFVGEMSPMGMLWTFLGSSLPYERLTGVMEVLPALLLLIPATAGLGALMAIVVLSNVVVLNFTYDVPVKLYSSQLLLIAVLLAWPEMQRLTDVLVRNRAVAPRAVTPLFAGRWRKWGRAVGFVLVAGCMALTLKALLTSTRAPTNQAAVPLGGAWDVMILTRGGRVISREDSTRWRRLSIVPDWGRASIRTETDSAVAMRLEIDSLAQKFTLSPSDSLLRKERAWKISAAWRIAGDSLVLNGMAGTDTLHLVAKRRDLSRMRLVSRGFHWIQEYPYNR